MKTLRKKSIFLFWHAYHHGLETLTDGISTKKSVIFIRNATSIYPWYFFVGYAGDAINFVLPNL